jgi:LuxR family maltose regulon positive regulatory protein
MAEVSMLSGQLHEAYVLCQRALAAAVDQEGQPLLVGAKILVTLGELHREWNELDKAAAILNQAIDLAGQWVELWAMSGHVILARVRQAQGDVDAARESMQIARQMAITYDTSEVDDLFVSAYQARLWLAQDDVQAAMRWAHERGLMASPGDDWPARYSPEPWTPYYLREFEQITLARLLLALDRPGQAKQVLLPLLEEAQEMGRTHSIIEIEALRSLALQALAFRGPPDFSEAISTLHHALSLAEAGGYKRLFIELGPAMAELLNRVYHQGLATEYCGMLLADIYGDRPRHEAAVSSRQPLLDPLSDRELEILRLLTTHLTGTEIASELSISANTVRFHTKNIYSKLGVHSRAEAVERAWALALL